MESAIRNSQSAILLLAYATDNEPWRGLLERLRQSALAAGWPEADLRLTLLPPPPRRPAGAECPKGTAKRDPREIRAVRERAAVIWRDLLLAHGTPVLYLAADSRITADPRELLDQVMADNPDACWAAGRKTTAEDTEDAERKDSVISVSALLFWGADAADVAGIWVAEDRQLPNLHAPAQVLRRLVEQGRVPPPAVLGELPITHVALGGLTTQSEPLAEGTDGQGQ